MTQITDDAAGVTEPERLARQLREMATEFLIDTDQPRTIANLQKCVTWQAADALASRPAPSEEGWQPIETAPKDQEVELRGTWKLGGGGVVFTHWRPMPADREIKPEIGAKS